MAPAPRANNGEASRRIMAELANASRYDGRDQPACGLFLGLQSSLLIGGETAGQTKLISQGRISNNASHPVPEITGNAFDESIGAGRGLPSERGHLPIRRADVELSDGAVSLDHFGSYVVAVQRDRKSKGSQTWLADHLLGALLRYLGAPRNNYDADESGPPFDGIKPYCGSPHVRPGQISGSRRSTPSPTRRRYIDRDGRSGPALDFGWTPQTGRTFASTAGSGRGGCSAAGQRSRPGADLPSTG